MTRGILIAGNESALFSAIEGEAAKRVEQYAAAVIPGPSTAPHADSDQRSADQRFGERGPEPRTAESGGLRSLQGPAEASEKGKQLLSWNPSSPLSARTLLLAAENRLGRIDEALLVCWPPAFYRSADALIPAEIDKYINDQFKGWFYLVRELAVNFKAQGGGTLALVLPDESFGREKSSAAKDADAELFGTSAAASFRALAEGLLASSGNGYCRILGFTGCSAGSEKEFAPWLFKIMDESSRKNKSRMYKYSKFSLFK